MSNIKLFESQKIRSHWDAEQEKWYFSVIDIIQVLTDSNNSRRYWSDLKRKLELEGFFHLYAILVQLKLESPDGKKYLTDCADTEGLLRIIQSIPSPKAEPFKQWLAKVGYERLEETRDLEKSIDRAMENYLKPCPLFPCQLVKKTPYLYPKTFHMTIMTVGEFKRDFSEALKRVQAGEEIAISYGKNKEIVARLVPKASPKKAKRKLGILKGKVQFNADFKMTEEEFLGI